MFQKQIFLKLFRQHCTKNEVFHYSFLRIWSHLLKKSVMENFISHKINHHLNCNDEWFIYLRSCKICGLQYVCSTTDRFLLRWNNYKDNGRKAQRGEEHIQPELFQHFHSKGRNGFLQDCSITLINKTDGSDPTRREEYWRVMLKTVAPYGLNRIE